MCRDTQCGKPTRFWGDRYFPVLAVPSHITVEDVTGHTGIQKVEVTEDDKGSILEMKYPRLEVQGYKGGENGWCRPSG